MTLLRCILKLWKCLKIYNTSVLKKIAESRESTYEYEFNRVFFGINSLRFQAQFVAQKHADNSRNEYPVAAEAVLKSTFLQLYEELDEI